MTRKLRARRSADTVGKSTEKEKSSEKTSRIAKEDLPKCTQGPCRKSLRKNKICITVPYQHRKDTFYNKWSRCEIEAFEELYKRLSRSRRRCHIFTTIANKLPRKTTGDCVEYYYLYKNIRSFKTRSAKEKQKRKHKENAK